MSKRVFVLCLSCLWLTACGDPYVRPPLPTPTQWSEPGSNPKDGLVPALTGWRHFFADPQLQSLIEASLTYNRDLRVAAARIEEARAMHGIAKAELLPSVSGGAGYNAALTPGNLGGSNQSVTGKRIDVSISMISYELDFWGRVSGLTESARASYLASEFAQQSLHLTLVAEVANAYFSYLEAEERVGIAQANLDSVEQSTQLVLQAHQAGYASGTERIHALNAIENARASKAAAKKEQDTAVNLLQFLAGKTPSKTELRKPLAEQVSSFDIAIGMPADVILARPDVQGAEQKLIAANANIGAARAAFLPKILLTGMLGTASQALSGLFIGGSQSWSFQPSISWPLFDAGRLAGNIDVAEARKVIAVAEYERLIQQAFWELSNLLTARTALFEQLRSGEASLLLKKEQHEVSTALYKGGQSGYLEVLEAEREILSAHQNVLQLRRLLLTSTTQLYKALGGGA